MAIVSSIYSTLGSGSSLVPLLIKDAANATGMTAGSYATGEKLEAKDRLIDEVGSGAIWLYGIPLYKKIIDKTLFRAIGYDPNFDVRNLKDEKVLQKIVQYSPTNIIKENINHAIKNTKSVKAWNMAKFGLSTALTIGSYLGLTEYRQKHTEACAKKEILAEMEKMKAVKAALAEETAKNANINTGTAPAFGSKFGAFKLQDFIFNPVENTKLIDVGITGSRLGKSRNKQDMIGYTIKEGGFWLFMYLLTKPIQKFFEKRAETKFNKSIRLDARVIESKELKELMENSKLAEHLENFPKWPTYTEDELKKMTDAQKAAAKEAEQAANVAIYEYLHTGKGNAVVEFAKQSEIVPTFGKYEVLAGEIDTRKFIDLGDVKGVHEELSKLLQQFKDSPESIDVFLKKVKGLKRTAILANIGTSMAFLGIVIPAIMVAIRHVGKDNKGFKVKEDLKKEMFKGLEA